VADLVEMIGRSRAWLFAVLKAQGVRSVERGRYRLADVLAAITAHYEALAEQQRGRLATNAKMNDLRAAEIEMRIKAKMAELVPMADLAEAITFVKGIVFEHLDLLEPRLQAIAGPGVDIGELLAGVRSRIDGAEDQGLELARTGIDPTDPDVKRSRRAKR